MNMNSNIFEGEGANRYFHSGFNPRPKMAEDC